LKNCSDENSEEDFEDWDSIGLNVSKPPNLLRLFRDFKRHVAPTKSTTERSTQTSPDEERERLFVEASKLRQEVDEFRRTSSERENFIVQLEKEVGEAKLKYNQVSVS
jgi:hypothetical protein